MYSSAIRGGGHEAGCGTNFWDFLKLPGHTQLIRAAAAGRALDRQAWQDAVKNLALLDFKKPQQAGRMTRSCACRGKSGSCCATLSSVRPVAEKCCRPGSLCNYCDLAAEDMEVIASGKASVKSKE